MLLASYHINFYASNPQWKDEMSTYPTYTYTHPTARFHAYSSLVAYISLFPSFRLSFSLSQCAYFDAIKSIGYMGTHLLLSRREQTRIIEWKNNLQQHITSHAKKKPSKNNVEYSLESLRCVHQTMSSSFRYRVSCCYAIIIQGKKLEIQQTTTKSLWRNAHTHMHTPLWFDLFIALSHLSSSSFSTCGITADSLVRSISLCLLLVHSLPFAPLFCCTIL